MVGTTALIAAGIAAGGSLGGSALASRAQTKATEKAIKAEKTIEEQRREDYAPWREVGEEALQELRTKIMEGPGPYVESPGYQFGLEEGLKTLERAASAKGTTRSGGQQKKLIRYAQDYASGDYNKFLERYYSSLRPLQSLAGVGQTAVGQESALGERTAGRLSELELAGGTARASGYINAANVLRSGMGDLVTLDELARQDFINRHMGEGIVGSPPSMVMR